LGERSFVTGSAAPLRGGHAHPRGGVPAPEPDPDRPHLPPRGPLRNSWAGNIRAPNAYAALGPAPPDPLPPPESCARRARSPAPVTAGGPPMPGIRRALLLAASLCLPSAALADDPYADYRIPDHHWFSWTAGLNGSGSHQRGQGFGGLLN